MSEQNNYTALKDLLASWKLLELLPHLQDEGINITELQLMKAHHVAELLQYHKLGIRIRFEHHFEKWRRDLNKPLQPISVPTTHIHYTSIPKKSKERDPPPVAHKLEPSGNLSQDSPPEVVRFLNSQNELPKLTPQPRLITSNVHPEEPPTIELSPSPTPTPAASFVTPSLCPLSSVDSIGGVQMDGDKTPLTLLHILRSSGLKGTSLLEYYQKHQQLLVAHRTILLQLIVNYFENNGLHMSLNVSYNLEEQILKLFPTEKLSYYRTEKRGKIYVKFCNMKRYRRDNLFPKRRWDGTMVGLNGSVKEAEVVNGNDEDEEYPMGFEWSDMQPPVDVQIKIEDGENSL